MYIKSLQLKNLRCFTEASVEFSKGINILTGTNNSGKSSIIKAVYRLQQDRIINSSDVRINEPSLEILLNIADISPKDQPIFSHARVSLQTKTQGAYVIFKHSAFGGSSSHIIEQEEHQTLTLDDINSIAENRPFAADFMTLPNSEDKQNLFYPFFAKRKMNHIGTQLGKENTFAIYEDFQNLTAKVQKASNNYRFSEKFKELCKELLGFNIALIPGENNDIKLGIYAGYNKTIPIESMGEGIINIIGLIIILLTEEGRIFLIEELENDLHPLVLKKFLNIIADKSIKNQFIISTHSNIILKYLGALPETKIFCTESILPENDHFNLNISTIKEIKNEFNDRKKVLDILGYDFYDFEMYSAFLIFEESTAERLFRDYLLPEFYPVLSNKIRTIASQGANDVERKFRDLNSLFLFLHKSEIYNKRAWVMIDGDDVGLEVIKKLRQKYTSWPEEHFLNFKNRNLEDYYPSAFNEDIANIKNINNRKEKQFQKGKLVENVIKWTSTNRQEAKKHFETNCTELINILKEVSLAIDKENP